MERALFSTLIFSTKRAELLEFCLSNFFFKLLQPRKDLYHFSLFILFWPDLVTWLPLTTRQLESVNIRVPRKETKVLVNTVLFGAVLLRSCLIQCSTSDQDHRTQREMKVKFWMRWMGNKRHISKQYWW